MTPSTPNGAPDPAPGPAKLAALIVAACALGIVACILLSGCAGSGNYHPPPPGGTPTPTPISGEPTPTPAPTPPPSIPDVPPLPEVARVVGSGECTGGQGSPTCKEGNSCAFKCLQREQFGLDCNLPALNATPTSTFTSGGSENIPDSIATTMYVAGGEQAKQAREFLIAYYAERIKRGLGREIFSAGYMAIVAANWVTVLNAAIERGDAGMVDAVSPLLDFWWTTLTLVAVNEPTRINRAWHHVEATKDVNFYADLALDGFVPPGRSLSRAKPEPNGDIFDEEAAEKIGGPSLALLGSRNYVNAYRDGAAGHRFAFCVALGLPGCAWDYSLDGGGTHASRAACGPIVWLDIPYSRQSGHANARGLVVPAMQVGLTPWKRAMLREYLESNGTRRQADLLASLRDRRLAFDLTVYRTERGVSAMFGPRDGSHFGGYSLSKGGPWIGVTCEGGVCTWLSRTTRQNQPEPVEGWWAGGQLCGKSTGLPIPRCIAEASGAVVSIIVWPRDGHPEVKL